MNKKGRLGWNMSMQIINQRKGEAMKDIKEKIREIVDNNLPIVSTVRNTHIDEVTNKLHELFERECEVEALKQEIAELKAEIENYKHALADTIG